jgi:hypothetical protein
MAGYAELRNPGVGMNGRRRLRVVLSHCRTGGPIRRSNCVWIAQLANSMSTTINRVRTYPLAEILMWRIKI